MFCIFFTCVSVVQIQSKHHQARYIYKYGTIKRLILIQVTLTHFWPSRKRKFNLKSDRVNLVAPVSPIECLLYLPNDWDRKGWPGSEIQMYYGCSCYIYALMLLNPSVVCKSAYYMFCIIMSSISFTVLRVLIL